MTRFSTFQCAVLCAVLFAQIVLAQTTTSCDDLNAKTIIFSVFILIVGVVFVILGNRLLEMIVILFGFVFVGVMTYVLIDENTTWEWYWILVCALVAGLVAALLCKLALKVAIFALGFGVGFIVGLIFVGSLQSYVDEANQQEQWFQIVCWVTVILFGVISGVILLAFQKYLIIAATSILGAFCIVISIDFLVGNGSLCTLLDDLANGIQPDIQARPMVILIVCWLALTVVGIIIQIFLASKRSSRVRQARGEILLLNAS